MFCSLDYGWIAGAQDNWRGNKVKVLKKFFNEQLMECVFMARTMPLFANNWSKPAFGINKTLNLTHSVQRHLKREILSNAQKYFKVHRNDIDITHFQMKWNPLNANIDPKIIPFHYYSMRVFCAACLIAKIHKKNILSSYFQSSKRWNVKCGTLSFA